MIIGSVCSGLGGIDLAFRQAGARIKYQAEPEPNCQTVLRRHFPGVHLVDRIEDVTGPAFAGIDCLVGGFPCQDLSVAGRRAGLAGERSGLWFELHRVLREYRPQWCLFENVPGLLSSNGGRDFAVVLGGLTGVIPSVPDGGWRTSGLAKGWFYNVAWRILDAQYHGVPQRRRRVFIVGSLGDGSPAEILFEPESMSWHSAPSREKGTRVASPIKQSTGKRGWGLGAEDAEGLIAATLTSGVSGDGVNRPGRRAEDDVNLVASGVDLQNHCLTDDVSPTLDRSRPGRGGGAAVLSLAVTADMQRMDGTAETLVTHSLTKRHDSGEGGTGRGTPLVVSSLDTSRGGADDDDEQGGRLVAQNVAENQRGEVLLSDVASSLSGGGGKPGRGYPAVFESSMAVRRLTPTECERLQSLPDGWTETGHDGKPLSDSARYAMIGNAVCVNVVAWIAERMVTAHRAIQVPAV